ncbi:hypothetical protein [Pseudomonas sp. 22 E 5]|jgi:hypothetical protein|nr:hypothetical protein [Pseudomonas sp. 22 E 5]
MRLLQYTPLLYTDSAAVSTTKLRMCAAVSLPISEKICTNGLPL